eukprot:COSAG01_NODE_190_length_22595_cov_16.442301_18_plen_539_part_00
MLVHPLPEKMGYSGVWRAVLGGVAVIALWGAVSSWKGSTPSLSKEDRVETPPARDIPAVRTLAYGTDFDTIDELFQMDEPCLVTGLLPELREQLLAAWSKDALLRSQLSSAEIGVRRSVGGGNYSGVMRYRDHQNLRVDARYMESLQTGVKWPRERYDTWTMTQGMTLQGAVINPPKGEAGSFSSASDVFAPVHPAGAATVQRLQRTICKMWNKRGGCPDTVDKDNLIWIGSPEVGIQLHYDSYANLYFHLYGNKEIILVPPPAMIDQAHVVPFIHPSARQSQIAWTDKHSSRLPSGFDTGADVQNDYDPSVELRVTLRPSDVLLLPSHWGHQTFTPGPGISVSVALWFFPFRIPGRKEPKLPLDLRGDGYDRARNGAMNEMLQHATSLKTAWGMLSALGVRLAADIAGSDEGGKTLRVTWLHQRWRPLYGSLDSKGDSQIPRILCDTSGLSAPHTVDAAHRLANHVRELGKWYSVKYRAATLRGEVMDILDKIVEGLKHLDRLPKKLKKAGAKSRGAMMVWMARSMAEECTVRQKDL